MFGISVTVAPCVVSGRVMFVLTMTRLRISPSLSVWILKPFIDDYTRLRMNRNGLSLIEKENHECIMLDGNACRINPVKPRQCRGFPNQWNFPGWQKVCQAKAIPMEKAREMGLVE